MLAAPGVSCVCSDVSRSKSDRVRVENARCRSIRVAADWRRRRADGLLANHRLCLPRLQGLAGFDVGARPFQSFDRLIKIRNSLVHWKIHKEPYHGFEEPESFAQKLLHSTALTNLLQPSKEWSASSPASSVKSARRGGWTQNTHTFSRCGPTNRGRGANSVATPARLFSGPLPAAKRLWAGGRRRIVSITQSPSPSPHQPPGTSGLY
jgi:hypothetical protein